MASAAAKRVIAEMRNRQKEPKLPLEQDRAEWVKNALGDPVPEGTTIEAAEVDGVACEWVTHPGVAGEGIFLLLHGGAYRAGSCITHRNLASRLSSVTGMRVLVPDYRLAPEHPFPAGLQDCLATYGGVLKQEPAHRVIVGGDSAGGGMALALLLALRDAGAPLPAAAVLLSAWTDILARGDSYKINQQDDPVINPEELRAAGRQYFADADPEHPLISPINAKLAGLPPLLMHAGGLETMRDDTTAFAKKAIDAGVKVTVEVWPEMWHVWHSHAADVPEAQDALDKVGEFVGAQLAVRR